MHARGLVPLVGPHFRLLRGDAHIRIRINRPVASFAKQNTSDLVADDLLDDSVTSTHNVEVDHNDQEATLSKEEGMRNSLWDVPWDGGCDPQLLSCCFSCNRLI